MVEDEVVVLLDYVLALVVGAIHVRAATPAHDVDVCPAVVDVHLVYVLSRNVSDVVNYFHILLALFALHHHLVVGLLLLTLHAVVCVVVSLVGLHVNLVT